MSCIGKSRKFFTTNKKKRSEKNDATSYSFGVNARLPVLSCNPFLTGINQRGRVFLLNRFVECRAALGQFAFWREAYSIKDTSRAAASTRQWSALARLC